MNNLNCQIVYVKKEYFYDFQIKEAMDINFNKDPSKRGYLCLSLVYKNNNIFVPLRSNIIDNSRFGVVGYPIPSKKRPNAGLDYRKLLIINDLSYIDIPSYIKIPKSQQKQLKKSFKTIKSQVIAYIKGYERSFIKKRTNRDAKYVYSTLKNYHKELNLT